MRTSLGRIGRRAAVTGAAVVVAVMATAPAALAAVGLPYDYNVVYINGGGGGASTAKFYTNSAGKLCYTSSFRVHKFKDNSKAPDLHYYVQLWRNDTFGDTKVGEDNHLASDSKSTYKTYGKACWTGLGKNQDYHFTFKKVTYDTGELEGKGTISLS